MAMAFSREGSQRVAVSFIGEGGSSLGEWHEAINLCAARRLPAIFCIQNNQTALWAGLQVGGQFAGRGRHAITTHGPARRDNKFSMYHRI